MALAPVSGLSALTSEVCAELVARFRAAGFTQRLVAEADAFYPGLVRPVRLPLVRFWLERQAGAGAVLARVFAFEDAVAEKNVAEALGRSLLDRLLDAGVLVGSAEGVRASFLLTPTEDELYVLSDRLGDGAQAVMGPGGGTEHLARLIPRTLRGDALDLGCGAGTLALVAARRGARRALGVDVNERAVELASFNARLNALAAEFRAGDGLAPVAGERFDLVVSQPPFVARPRQQAERTFLYGGTSGDELPTRFLGEAASALAPGGRAIFLLQAPEREEEPLMVRVQRAFGASPPHVLVLSGPGPSPATQASVFAALEDPSFGPTYAECARRHLEHFAELGVRAFAGAVVVLTNPPDAAGPGRYALALSLRNPPNDAAALELYLESLDLIEAPAAVLESSRLRLSPHARVSRVLAESEDEGAGDAIAAVVQIVAPGIGSDLRVSSGELRVLAAIDNAAKLGDVLDAVGHAAPNHGTFRDELRAFARTALVHGALVPA